MNADHRVRNFKDDRLLNLVNSNFVSLKDKDIARNNAILHPILKEVVEKMKQKDEFFREHFRDIIFAGSYYKGTKVGKPEEFDLNLVIQLPLKYESIKFERNYPGFTKLKLDKDSYRLGLVRDRQVSDKWVTTDYYLDQDAFRRHMEGVFTAIPKVVTVGAKNYGLNVRKSAPAFTLGVKGLGDSLEMSVDLVPVLEFKKKPPIPGDFVTESWFAVPKAKLGLSESNVQWRMSFYPYEKTLLKKYHHLKPVIRLLKKLRDTEDWKALSSYYIETLVFHRITVIDANPQLQINSLTEHFVNMLGELKKACETRKIVNYWDRSHNLIAGVKPEQLTNIALRLENIIKQIEKDPLAIANFILTKDERNSIQGELIRFQTIG